MAIFGDCLATFDGCLNANLPIPAAIAIRTTFDKATEYMEIDPALNFGRKLKALFDLGKIGEDEQEALQVLVDAGQVQPIIKAGSLLPEI